MVAASVERAKQRRQTGQGEQPKAFGRPRGRNLHVLTSPPRRTGMNRHRSKRRQQTIHVWTYEQARQAQPYLASILRSLRDHLLEARFHERDAERLARRAGRPTRADLIAQEEA